MENKIFKILSDMSEELNYQQLEKLQQVLLTRLSDETEVEEKVLDNNDYLELFVSAKRVEGCTERTIEYYRVTIEKMLDEINIPVRRITTEILREYLTAYQMKNNCSKVTIDNVRRNLSSFFSWLEDEDHIIKSPIRRIHKVKTGTVVRETLSDEQIELLRDGCHCSRDLAIIDLLYSTGMRVGELCNLDRDDINFNERECIVYGKGNKERRVYFDAKAKLHLQKYLKRRIDSNPALFVSMDAPFDRLSIHAIEAGWVIGRNCTIEEPVTGMPNATGTGYVDYVLWGKDNLPLAVVEAKKASKDTIIGSQQAKLYADCLQNKYNQRPLIFTTNGFEHYYTNDACGYPRREVSGFFTQDELQLEVDRRKSRIPLEQIEISDKITNRPYQKEAVTAVCDSIMKKHRKMLIVQATGSGKTRVSISIVDVLRRHNYVKNILFLADRTALVKQAKNNYTNLLEDLSCCNLCDSKDDPESARMIFSTYPTMMNAIDEKKNKYGERLFSPGHFDLIICDEVHRSIYKKYQEIFEYFDGMLLGMTATPKNEIDKNTYGVFDLERGVPTFAYELEKAVEEGYLVNYSTLEYKTKIMEDGIHYHDLSEEEKEEFEKEFADDYRIKDDVASSAINTWLFNSDTIDKVLKELMEKGLKVEGGDKLGKTIIFAKNSLHAKAIVDRFNKLFPECGGEFIKQIDYSINYCDTLIDDFSTSEKMPQIAVSVDMLDTGIDIPEILNLVFFKKVRSYAKFWQMIGRGTRLCPNLLGEGIDKKRFLIFDFCNNFEYFRVNKNGSDNGIQETLSEKIYNTKAMICRELQSPIWIMEIMQLQIWEHYYWRRT